MDQEDAFANEAQEEVILSERQRREQNSEDKDNVRTSTQEDDLSQDEISPLIGTYPRRPAHTTDSRAGASYQRAINEPWTGSHKADNLTWWNRPSILWLLPAFFPFCIAFGGIIVPKQYLVLDLICRDYLSEQSRLDPTFKFMPVVLGGQNPQCRIPEVQSLVAKFILYQYLLSGIFAAVVAPLLGAFSDRIGRKPIMICCSFGSFVMEIITIIVGRNPDTISVYWILLGSLLDGLCGSFTTGIALSSLTPPTADPLNVATQHSDTSTVPCSWASLLVP